MQGGGREKSIASQEADPTPSLAVLQGRRMHGQGGSCSETLTQPGTEAHQILQVATHRASVPAARTPPLTSPAMHLSIACPGSEGVAISQPTESLQTVSIWVTSSPVEAQGQPGPAICEQLLPALRRDASSADAAHKARKSQAKSTQGAWPIPPLRVHPSSSASSGWISGKQHPALELGMVPQDPPQNNTWSW